MSNNLFWSSPTAIYLGSFSLDELGSLGEPGAHFLQAVDVSDEYCSLELEFWPGVLLFARIERANSCPSLKK